MKYILSVCLLVVFSFKHPFYLGLTELTYDAKQRSMQCAVKLFTNDLEAALKKINKRSVDLINIKDTTDTENILQTYLQKRLVLKINGKLKTFVFIGFEREEEAIWMYLEYGNCDLPKKVEIQNTLLFDYIDTQTNIVHLEVMGIKKSLKSSYPDKDFIFDLR